MLSTGTAYISIWIRTVYLKICVMRMIAVMIIIHVTDFSSPISVTKHIYINYAFLLKPNYLQLIPCHTPLPSIWNISGGSRMFIAAGVLTAEEGTLASHASVIPEMINHFFSKRYRLQHIHAYFTTSVVIFLLSYPHIPLKMGQFLFVFKLRFTN